jgi:hypothetical protein
MNARLRRRLVIFGVLWFVISFLAAYSQRGLRLWLPGGTPRAIGLPHGGR